MRPLVGAGRELPPCAPVNVPFATGIKVIDSMTTLGRGQRMGIFASRVGKSTLLASIARHASSEVNVIALIGERGREVQEFIRDSLGPEGLSRSVVVVATSDESPLLRVRARVATAIAEYFRDLDGGRHVLGHGFADCRSATTGRSCRWRDSRHARPSTFRLLHAAGPR